MILQKIHGVTISFMATFGIQHGVEVECLTVFSVKCVSGSGIFFLN